MAKKRWLEPNTLSDEDRAALQRVAKERHMSLDDVIAQLEVEQEKAKAPKPKPPQHPAQALPKQQRIDPKAIIERPDPVPIAEHSYTPEPESRPTKPAPDPLLVEIAQLWQHLSERDRRELNLIAKMKAHFKDS